MSLSADKPNKPAVSSNWEALKKSIGANNGPRGIKRKRGGFHERTSNTIQNVPNKTATSGENEEIESFPRGNTYAEVVRSTAKASAHTVTEPVTKRPKTVTDEMRSLVLGTLSKSQEAEQGKYVALDCEMVGVGPNGSQSSLARVSVVNYHGAVLLDKFVRQMERVTDYRTRWSGIRPKDLQGAEEFKVVQAEVAKLMDDRIVVGHALSHDMQALLLSHPHHHTRDTQTYAELRKLAKTKQPALRKLIQLELGLDIQAGEHDSITDARASMALFRLHKNAWDRTLPASHHLLAKDGKGRPGKGKTESDNVGGRKGISSGLSVVTRVKEKNGVVSTRMSGKGRKHVEEEDGGSVRTRTESAWWETLTEDGKQHNMKGRKASLRMRT
ncbi:ribonuclease H-like protein [Dacryopinax primogenitus]|uniref:RNA exonuclease 4 n=1 Tax=Dacryopinax primogenitus (strain DJM 731) TaxID=1858805 RepID=M5FPD0_DACPD|nr:ribonuclease H-like protein [Dacryopinax primogenitus]EJT96983.1 ribonuclease H-like protein [Dacryopinax primogenitus]